VAFVSLTQRIENTTGKMCSQFPLLSVETGKDEAEFVELGVNWLKYKIQHILKNKLFCVVGLSGGTTPGPIYYKLFESNEVDWNKVFIFLIDERYIEDNSQYSNTMLVRCAAKSLAGGYKTFVEEHFSFPNTTLPIDECVSQYDKALKQVFQEKNAGTYGADIQVLGLGDDGHIASLFPPVGKVLREQKKVVHTFTDKNPVRSRISLSLDLLEQASYSVFFIKGESKIRVWNEMVESSYNPERWPAHVVLSKSKTTLVVNTEKSTISIKN